MSELEKLSLYYGAMDMGAVEIKNAITTGQLEEVKVALSKSGLEVMEDEKASLIEEIKHAIVKMINDTDEHTTDNFSDSLSKKLKYAYTYLNSLFSEATGITIEHYTTSLKMERVKELLLYDELTLAQISHKLHYSSVAQLSREFKNITGLTTAFFKRVKIKRQRMSAQT